MHIKGVVFNSLECFPQEKPLRFHEPGLPRPVKYRGCHQGQAVGQAEWFDLTRLTAEIALIVRIDPKPITVLLGECRGIIQHAPLQKDRPSLSPTSSSQHLSILNTSSVDGLNSILYFSKAGSSGIL